MKTLFLFLFLIASFFSVTCFAQSETTASFHDTTAIKKTAKDSTTKKIFRPRTAAIRSAILPGWGQIYNKKYWKLPIVYGALGISGAVFFYNLKNYKDTRFAYKVKYNMRVFKTDSSLLSQIKPQLLPLSEESLRFYRNEFRRDIDYSALVFLLLWGLNVVDATVDAHLKSFDVSPDLSLQIKPGYSEMAGTNGLSLVFKIR
ncbi:MAG: hypothetical protein JST17_09010 [Bacteroidetes bacterium]|nr:hypothetical protein [Bacteroidota bacterium]MBS1932067.1 hypothetical protein [Bacteroidota bacterium]